MDEEGVTEGPQHLAGPRVLHIIASLAIGGTEAQLVRFIDRSSDPSRHTVAVFDRLGPLAERVPNPPIWLGNVSRDPRRSLTSLRTAMNLRRLMRSSRFDLLHAHLGISEVLAIAVPRSIPVVASRRGPNLGFERRRAYKLLEGLGHRRTDILISNTRFWAEAAEREDLWTPVTRVIPNAIDPNEFPVAPMPPDASPIVGVVANLHPYKRHDLFLRALKIVAGRLPTVRAVFAGDGVARPQLEQLTTELGLADHVTFAGQVSDTRPLVAGCHVVALTSSTEGFPNALLEAMSQARPVVATRVGGAPELVRHGLDGFLTSDDPAEIAARLRSVLADRDLRTRMASSARERAEVFSWDKLVRDTESVYREVLAMPRGSRRPRSRRSDLAPHAF